MVLASVHCGGEPWEVVALKVVQVDMVEWDEVGVRGDEPCPVAVAVAVVDGGKGTAVLGTCTGRGFDAFLTICGRAARQQLPLFEGSKAHREDVVQVSDGEVTAGDV